MIKPHYGWYKSFKPLMIGLTLSVLLTMASYRMLTRYHLTHSHLVVTLFSLSIVQALAQFVFFLHLGIEQKPRWNVLLFLLALFIMCIVIGGSIWIMENLNYNLMTVEEMKKING